MRHILYALGWLWLLPVNILAGLFFFLPHYIKGTFSQVNWDWETWCMLWDVANDSEFYKEAMEGWWGFVIGNNIVFVDYKPKSENIHVQHMIHEETHVIQNYILGVFFYPAYIANSGWIYLMRLDKHAYIDNVFERWARRRAGERVEIPIEDWTDGPNDRWPWW